MMAFDFLWIKWGWMCYDGRRTRGCMAWGVTWVWCGSIDSRFEMYGVASLVYMYVADWL